MSTREAADQSGADVAGDTSLSAPSDAKHDWISANTAKPSIKPKTRWARFKAWLHSSSPEHGLRALPRADGVTLSAWRSDDVGFYLPSSYFEREDGATPSSMAEDDDSWAVSTLAMRRTMELAEHDDQISALFSDRASKRERADAAEKLVLLALQSRSNVNSSKAAHPEQRRP